jgi:hypothetical protein
VKAAKSQSRSGALRRRLRGFFFRPVIIDN